MSITRGLIATEDINFGTGTFTRKGRTGFDITVNQVSDLIQGIGGPLIDARRYSDFNDAVTAAIGKTLLIAGTITLPAGAITIPATVLGVFPLAPGVIGKGSATSLTINAPVVGNPMHQWLSGFAAGEVKLSSPVKPEWLATSGTGVYASPYLINLNIVDAATDGGADGDDNRSIIITEGKAYQLVSPPGILTKTLNMRGRGFITNVNAGGADAIVTPDGGNSDYLTIEDIVIRGGANTGKGLYIRDARRWTLKNVRVNGHSSHGLYIEESWIGRIFGGRFGANGGDGIKLVPSASGAPAGTTIVGAEIAANTGWGIRAGDTSVYNGSINSLTILGGVIEQNTLGGIKAEGITNLLVEGVHFEESTIAIEIGTDPLNNVQKAIIRDCYDPHMIIGSSVGSCEVNGGRMFMTGGVTLATATRIAVNTKGKFTLKNLHAQVSGNSPNTICVKETSPNEPTYYSCFNIGIKHPGNLLKNGAFHIRVNNSSTPEQWSYAGVSSQASLAVDDVTHYLNPNTYGRIHQVVTNAADGGISQTFTFPRNPSQPLYASVWCKKSGGTVGLFQVTVGSRSWRIEFSNTYWNRITIPCILDPGDNTQGTILLGAVDSSATVQFAEAQIVSDMNLEGWRYNADEYQAGLKIFDGVSIPDTASGQTTIYVDQADGDLKVKFGDGTVKTIVVDT